MSQNNSFSENPEKIFKYYTDTREENEIQLTNRLVRSLSDLNMQLLNHHPPATTPSIKSLKKQDFLYVCINGVPPF